MEPENAEEKLWQAQPTIQLGKDATKLSDDHPTFRRQIFIASGPCILMVTKGLIAGYSATMLPQIKADESFEKITISQESWIASALIPAMAIGSILGGYLSERYGRRTTHIWWIVPQALSWLVIGFATNVEVVILGRFLTGFLNTLSSPASMAFVAESTSPRYRGFLATALFSGMAVGIMLVHIYAPLVTWRMTAHISFALTLLSLIPFWFVPESPSWLIKHGRFEEGQRALYWCKGRSEEATQELIQLKNQRRTTSSEAKLSWKDLTKPEIWKPFFIINFYSLVSQWSGYNVIGFYSVDIIRKTIGGEVDEYISVLILDLVRVVMSVISCYFLRYFGVRKTTFLSGLVSSLCLFGLCVFTFYQTKSPIISLLLILTFIFFVSLGFVPIPWNLMGELLPLSIRTSAAGLTSSISFLCTFSTVLTGPFMFEYLGQPMTYLVYSLASLVGTVVLYFILPETKGKTLQELENEFAKK